MSKYFRQFGAKLLTETEQLLQLPEDVDFCVDYIGDFDTIRVYDCNFDYFDVGFDLDADSKIPSVKIWNFGCGEEEDPKLLGTIPISVILNNDLEWQELLNKVRNKNDT